MKIINGDALGYHIDKNGTEKLDKYQKKIPITISRSSFFRYKADLTDPPTLYKELATFA